MYIILQEKIRLIILCENVQFFPQAYQKCITINNEGEICSYNICLGSHAVDLLPIYYLKSFLLHKQFSQTSVLSIDLVLMQLFVENVGYKVFVYGKMHWSIYVKTHCIIETIEY